MKSGTSSSKIPTGSARPWPASLGEGGVLESETSMHNVLDGARRGKRLSSTSCLTGMGTKVWVGAWPSARRSASSSGVALLGSGVVGGAGAGLSCLRKASLAFMLEMICLQESAKRSPRGHLILLTLHSFSLGGAVVDVVFGKNDEHSPFQNCHGISGCDIANCCLTSFMKAAWEKHKLSGIPASSG